MIPVVRTPCPPTLDPTNSESAGQKELRKVTAKRARGEALTNKDFNAYGNRSVRVALQVMFHGKCAYCESKIAGSQDTDVEHYRPKGGVSDADEAARWQAWATRAIDRLERRTEDKMPFAGMARAFLALVQAEVADMQTA